MREPIFTTLFPKLFKEENEDLPHYLHNYLRGRINSFVNDVGIVVSLP
jgi:hypothetical protein